tara:strand:- start:326 stop:841 length:516 start_codon:yes stop_codon:yes gene_type:complete
MIFLISGKYNINKSIEGGTSQCVPLNSNELKLYFTNNSSEEKFYKLYSDKMFFNTFIDTLIDSPYSYTPYFNDIEDSSKRALYIKDSNNRGQVTILGYTNTVVSEIKLRNNIYYYDGEFAYNFEKIELNPVQEAQIISNFASWDDLYNKIKQLVDNGQSIKGKTINEINLM